MSEIRCFLDQHSPGRFGADNAPTLPWLDPDVNNENSVRIYLKKFIHVVQLLQFIAAGQQLLGERNRPLHSVIHRSVFRVAGL